jgi:RNA polymerase sigma factor (sigma-70 family)
MKSSSFEKAIEAQFDCLTKKVIKYTQKKYYRDISRRWRNEISFSDLSEMELNHFGTLDDYSSDYTVFSVLGMEVQISDEQLSKALKILPEKKRNIILLSYFMDMSDLEIGKLMNLVRSTIYRHRTSTLEEIRKMYKEESDHEKK